jgi:hypothetical protein
VGSGTRPVQTQLFKKKKKKIMKIRAIENLTLGHLCGTRQKFSFKHRPKNTILKFFRYETIVRHPAGPCESVENPTHRSVPQVPDPADQGDCGSHSRVDQASTRVHKVGRRLRVDYLHSHNKYL